MNASDFEDKYRIDWLTAEFYHDETEQRFRDHTYQGRLKDTRQAIVIAGLFFLAFLYTDYTYGGDSEGFVYALISRVAVFMIALLGLRLAGTHKEWLNNGAIPTVLVALGMSQYMMIMLWIPYDVANRGMGILAMLFGTYIFIPNRFMLASLVAVAISIIYLPLTLLWYDFGINQYRSIAGFLFITNMMGVVIAHRISRMMREEFRDHERVNRSNRLLQVEIEERQRLEGVLRHNAEIDEATGIANRSRLFELIAEHGYEHSGRLAVLLIDVDYFKQINGTYGYLRSDEILRALVMVCESLLDQGQSLARLSGDEFVVLLPGMGLEEAGELAERIRSECQRTPVAMGDVYVHFTVSVGVARHRPGDSIQVTLRRADEAASLAKYRGRNRAELAA